MRKFPNDIKTKVSGCLRLTSKKKVHGRLMAAAMLVLPFGLGKFGHGLEVDLQKKTFASRSSNFGHDPFFGKI